MSPLFLFLTIQSVLIGPNLLTRPSNSFKFDPSLPCQPFDSPLYPPALKFECWTHWETRERAGVWSVKEGRLSPSDVTPVFRWMSPGNMSHVPAVCRCCDCPPPSPLTRLSWHYNVRCKIVSKYQLVISDQQGGINSLVPTSQHH